MKFLITGVSGFVGEELSYFFQKNKNNSVLGIDKNEEYANNKIKFQKCDLVNDINTLEKIFSEFKPDLVINLAAQAGVRYSIKNPKAYFDSNILGFFNIIDLSAKFHIKHFIYASTSSVYGEQNKFPITEKMNTNNPLSFYAASKKCNEVISHSYSFIHKLPTTGLRFFTVYGSYGRPDMALFKFTKGILNNKKIDLYNKGNHIRDFTHISYISSAFQKIIRKKPNSKIPFEIYNIGGSKPEPLKKFIHILEKTLRKKSKHNYMNLQTGDIHKTHASNKKLKKVFNFKYKNIDIEKGIKSFVDWYKSFYNVK